MSAKQFLLSRLSPRCATPVVKVLADLRAQPRTLDGLSFPP